MKKFCLYLALEKCQFQALDSQDPNTVDGALRTLREFSADISDEHAPIMLGQILPRLINVMMGNNHPISISRSLQILTNLTAMCGDLKVASISNDHFASMLEVFKHCIQKRIDQDYLHSPPLQKMNLLAFALPLALAWPCSRSFGASLSLQWRAHKIIRDAIFAEQ